MAAKHFDGTWKGRPLEVDAVSPGVSVRHCPTLQPLPLPRLPSPAHDYSARSDTDAATSGGSTQRYK